jgi:hypothetical protein
MFHLRIPTPITITNNYVFTKSFLNRIQVLVVGVDILVLHQELQDKETLVEHILIQVMVRITLQEEVEAQAGLEAHEYIRKVVMVV